MNPPSGFLRRTARRTFRDRREAGRALAEELKSYRDKDDLLVLGLARGGVPVGWEIASALHAALDVFLVRKLGVPGWPELAMGALASGGGVVMNDNVGGRTGVNARNKIVMIVDDGIATGASMLAAVRAVRAVGPQSIVVAVPVGPQSVCRELARAADDVVCVTMPPSFEAVGQVYADFHQITDDEVRELLNTPTG
jgi:predicted phosphoribosyltransferase